MKRKTRHILIVLLTTTFLTGALLHGLIYYAIRHHGGVRIAALINRLIPGKLGWEDLEIHLLTGRIVVKDFYLEGAEQEDLAGFQRLEVNWEWLPLLKGSLHFKTIRLDKPRLDLGFGPDGALNLVRAFAPTSEGKENQEDASSRFILPLNIGIESLEISGGRFALNGEADELNVRMTDIQARLSGDLREARAKAHIQTGAGRIAIDGMDFPLKRLDAEAELANGQIDPLRIRIETNSSWAQLEGTLSDLMTAPGMDLKIQTGVSLDELAQAMGLGSNLSGQVSGNAIARGIWPRPEVKLRLKMGAGAVYGQKIDRARASIRMAESRVRVQPVELFASGGKLTIKGEIDLTGVFAKAGGNAQAATPITYHALVDAKGIDLKELVWLQGQIGGTGRMTFSGEGQGVDLASLDVSGGMRVQCEDVALPGLAKTVDADIAAKLAVKEGRLDIKELTLKTDGVHLTGGGTIGVANGSLNAKVQVESDGAELFKNFGVSGSGGQITIAAEGGGDIFRPKATASVEAHHLRIGGIALGDLNARVDLDRKGVGRVRDLKLANGRSNLTAEGSIRLRPSFSNPPVDVTVRLDAVHPEEFFEGIPLTGAFNGEIHAHGAVLAPEARATLEIQDIRMETGVGAAVFNRGRVVADLDAQGWVTVSTLRLANRETGLSVRGKMKAFKGWRLDDEMPWDAFLDIDGIALGDFLEADIAGAVKGRLHVSETLFNPEASLLVDVDGLRMKDIDLGTLRLAARLQDGRVDIEQCALTNKQSRLIMEGAANIGIRGNANGSFFSDLGLRLHGANIRLEDFSGKAAGLLTVDARVEGTYPALSGKARLTAEDLSILGRSLGDVSIVSTLDDSTLRVAPLAIALPDGGKIEGDGWIARNRSFEFRLSSPGFEIGQFEDIRYLQMTAGQVEADIRGSGTLDNPEIQGRLRLKQGRAGDVRLPDGDIHFDLKDQTTDLEVIFEPIRAQGRWNMADMTFAASLRCQAADLAPYFTVAGWNDWGGRLTATAALNGRLDRPDLLAGQVRLEALALDYRNNPVIRTQDAVVRFAKGRIEAPPIRVTLADEGELVIQGGGRSIDDLEISLQGALPLRAASLFLEEPDDIAGDLNFRAEIKGSLTAPQIIADAILADAGFTVPYLLQSLHGLNGHIRLTNHELTMDELKGKLDAGRFTLSGKIDLRDFRPTAIDVNAKATALPLQIPDAMDMTVNIKLHVTGAPEASFVNGEAVILEGTYYRDFKINPIKELAQPKRAATESENEITLPFLQNLTMDISITRRSPFRVENNLADLLISPDLQIAGTLNRPLIRGRTAVDSGTFLYSKREFVVEKGVIDFINPYKAEPFLDIRGKVIVRDWTISLEVSGPPDEIVFHLSSDPPEEDADILSLLVFGKTGREMMMGEGQAPKSAGEMMIELVSNRFGNDIKNATGIDILEVRKGVPGGTGGANSANATNGADTTDPFSVTVGKEISRRMTVKYALESLEGEINQRAIAEYYFFENILLNGFQDSTGNFGGEMKFRLEFR